MKFYFGLNLLRVDSRFSTGAYEVLGRMIQWLGSYLLERRHKLCPVLTWGVKQS